MVDEKQMYPQRGTVTFKFRAESIFRPYFLKNEPGRAMIASGEEISPLNNTIEFFMRSICLYRGIDIRLQDYLKLM